MTAAFSEGLQKVQEILLWLYLLGLSLWDLRRKELPLWLLAAGAAAGMTLRSMSAAAGQNLEELCGTYIPGLAVGALLLAGAKLTREEIGYGDGLCFCTLAFWLPWGDLLTLLLLALLLCGIPGVIVSLIRREKKKSLPFLPFVTGAHLVLRLAEAFAGASP